MWDVELAKRINKIDRKTDRGIGHGIGVIVSKSPLKISLMARCFLMKMTLQLQIHSRSKA